MIFIKNRTFKEAHLKQILKNGQFGGRHGIDDSKADGTALRAQYAITSSFFPFRSWNISLFPTPGDQHSIIYKGIPRIYVQGRYFQEVQGKNVHVV